MINRKNLLGKTPEELGVKDAIHTAIVSVRAATPIKPGQRCGLNQYNEAIPVKDGPGVADPFLKRAVLRGEAFWLILAQDEVPNVQHVWEHPDVKFEAPTRPPEQNRTIAESAKALGVTYEQLMEAAERAVKRNKSTPYPGSLTASELEAVLDGDDDFDPYNFWDEWASESLHKFSNIGSDCCPEYEFPDVPLFDFK